MGNNEGVALGWFVVAPFGAWGNSATPKLRQQGLPRASHGVGALPRWRVGLVSLPSPSWCEQLMSKPL